MASYELNANVRISKLGVSSECVCECFCVARSNPTGTETTLVFHFHLFVSLSLSLSLSLFFSLSLLSNHQHLTSFLSLRSLTISDIPPCVHKETYVCPAAVQSSKALTTNDRVSVSFRASLVPLLVVSWWCSKFFSLFPFRVTGLSSADGDVDNAVEGGRRVQFSPVLVILRPALRWNIALVVVVVVAVVVDGGAGYDTATVAVVKWQPNKSRLSPGNV